MTLIVRPVTPDRMVGFDQFGQFIVSWRERDSVISTHACDVRQVICPLCVRGWELSGAAFADQERWDLIDAMVHRSCLVRHIGFVERADYQTALIGARIRFTGLMAIENGYSRDEWSRPWYQTDVVEHPLRFVLGKRKNVHHIALVATDAASLAWIEAAEAAFAAEQVTKEFTVRGVLLHAWGTDKVREYLGALARVAGIDKRGTP